MAAIVLERGATEEEITGSTEGVSPKIIRQITGAATNEINAEGHDRGLRTRGMTMRAGDLCPEQGKRAGRGFLNQLR